MQSGTSFLHLAGAERQQITRGSEKVREAVQVSAKHCLSVPIHFLNADNLQMENFF